MKNFLKYGLICLVCICNAACTIKQENAVLDVLSPRKIIGHETVYKYNFIKNEVEDVLRSQPIYLDGEGEVIYIEIDDDRLGFRELNNPIYLNSGVVLRYAADKYLVEELPDIE